MDEIRAISRIRVGKNIHVSRAYAPVPLRGNSDHTPDRPETTARRGHVPAAPNKARSDKCLVYTSADGGRTWRVAFVDWARPDDAPIDPTVAFGPARLLR